MWAEPLGPRLEHMQASLYPILLPFSSFGSVAQATAAPVLTPYRRVFPFLGHPPLPKGLPLALALGRLSTVCAACWVPSSFLQDWQVGSVQVSSRGAADLQGAVD